MITQLNVSCETNTGGWLRVLGWLLPFALCAGLLSGCAGAPAGEMVRVQRPDGSRQCRGDGTPPAAMRARLTDAGIPVHCSEKARDGRARVAMCGAATGRINVYTIPAGKLEQARDLGFERLPDTATGVERC